MTHENEAGKDEIVEGVSEPKLSRADAPLIAEQAYPCFDKAEWFAIFSAGNFGFRFGPFSGPEIGKIIERCVAEDTHALITANCGSSIDWEMVSNFRQEADPERRASAHKVSDILSLLLTTARILRARLPEMAPSYVSDDADALDDALKPFDSARGPSP